MWTFGNRTETTNHTRTARKENQSELTWPSHDMNRAKAFHMEMRIHRPGHNYKYDIVCIQSSLLGAGAGACMREKHSRQTKGAGTI